MKTLLPLIIALWAASPALAEERERKTDRAPKIPPHRFLETFDLDEDGKVSFEEFSKGERIAGLAIEDREKIFNRFDENRDGFITHGELQKASPKRRHRSLRHADRNQDGKVSFEEFGKHPPFAKMPEERKKKLFGRLDQNGDGFLDRQDGKQWDKPRGGPRPRFPFKKLDDDQSETLSWEEFQKARSLKEMSLESKERMFTRFDRDGDGLLTREELPRPRPKR